MCLSIDFDPVHAHMVSVDPHILSNKLQKLPAGYCRRAAEISYNEKVRLWKNTNYTNVLAEKCPGPMSSPVSEMLISC